MGRSLLLLCLGLMMGAVSAATPRADAYWAEGDYRRAFAEAFEPAARGDAHAQFLLGEAYRLGRSVDANYPLATEYYGRAARQGDIAAATELGLLLVGQGLPSAALPWLTLAARHGAPRALYGLGGLYLSGKAVERDEALAYALMSRAAAAGLSDAQTKIAALAKQLEPETLARGEALARAPWSDTAAPAGSDSPPDRPPRPVRIQIGSFRSAAAAERAWALLGGRVDGTTLASHQVVRAGSFYRLRVELIPAEAGKFRQSLKAARWQSFVF